MATSTIAGIGEVERRELVAVRPAAAAQHRGPPRRLLPPAHRRIRHNSHSLIRDVGTMARLGVAVALFISVLMFEIRAITRARHPMLRAGVAMSVVIPLFLVFFAWIYLNMSASDAGDFGGHMTG